MSKKILINICFFFLLNIKYFSCGIGKNAISYVLAELWISLVQEYTRELTY
jgi:hypothetical protein